nr:RNA-directed DNA polymerase, eukaryota [Tanacetum cinerariifolium]
MLQDVKSYLGRCFAMKDLGKAAYILGVKIYRDRSKRLIGLCQSAYIEKILKRYFKENSKCGTIPMQEKMKLSKSQDASTPAEIQRMQNVPYPLAVGLIMYVARCTRPDVAFALNITSLIQHNPGELHWTTVKNIMKYIRNARDMFLVYGGDTKRELRVSCYTDARYLTDADDLKSHTGYVFVLNGDVIDRKNTKQSIFATSSTDAEYIDAFDASKEADFVAEGDNKMLNFMNKLKNLKTRIREWNGSRQTLKNSKKRLIRELSNVDRLIDQGVLDAGKWIEDSSLVKQEFLSHFQNRFSKPMRLRPILSTDFPRKLNSFQRIDMKADVGSDEIKKAVWDCGVDKSPGPDGFTFDFYRRFWNIIGNDVVEAVQFFFQHGKMAKGCNSTFIALIPKIPDANMVKDFRPTSLISSLYKVIAKVLANRLVTVLGDTISEVQSAFVEERQILDGPFILNEVLQWCKSKKKQSFIFKIDFEKAYDLVRWDYLVDVLLKFGFENRWCGWIKECLQSSWGSVVVNGSPTKEFQFFRGLKQGDPLSPFLFILVMESLHISFQKVVDANMFKGIELSSFMCFERASGLCINLSKSKILGIAVDKDKVEQAASRIGCGILDLSFSYLGSNVGGNMARIQSWKEVEDILVKRLLKWKMKSLSIGGRLTLLKPVLGSIPIYHMSIFKVPLKVLQGMESLRSIFFNGVDSGSKKSIWIKWNKVLVSKEKGGLGVSSLYALNRAILLKWVWRFITQKNILWSKVITAIYGVDGNISSNLKSVYRSIWRDILQVLANVKNQGSDFLAHIQKRLGNGVDTSFGEETWLEDTALKYRYLRLFALEMNKQISVADKLAQEGLGSSFRRAPRGGLESQLSGLISKVGDIRLVNKSDRWIWDLESSGSFSVASVRKEIDLMRLDDVSSQTRWIKEVPIKLNVHGR